MALFNTPTTAQSSTTGDLSKDVEIKQGMPEDSISDLCFSPTMDILAMSSWDTSITIFEITNAGPVGKFRSVLKPDGEIPLCLAWSPDGTKLAAGGANGTVFFYDLQQCANAPNPLEVPATAKWKPHEAGIKGIRWFVFQGKPILITGSWDKTVKYFDVTSPTPTTPMGTLAVQERVYSMDVKNELLVIATAERHIHIVNLQKPIELHKTITSPLKWQTRVVSCFSDATGFAVGSIEGRCAIQYVDDSNTSLNFSFKCHRQPDPTQRDLARVYSVNAISFHPVHGTFSTAGSDGTFHFWDKDAKHRLKGYPDVGGSITATAFNKDGSIFAYAISYDWSKGYSGSLPTNKLAVRLHPVVGDECKPRPGSKKR